MKKIIITTTMIFLLSAASASAFSFQSGWEGQCPASERLTQNLRSGAYNGEYHPYTQGIVTEAHLLQRHLNRLGFSSGVEDGKLGPISTGAIMRMQGHLGTKADGIVGPNTRALLNNSCGNSVSVENSQQNSGTSFTLSIDQDDGVDLFGSLGFFDAFEGAGLIGMMTTLLIESQISFIETSSNEEFDEQVAASEEIIEKVKSDDRYDEVENILNKGEISKNDVEELLVIFDDELGEQNINENDYTDEEIEEFLVFLNLAQGMGLFDFQSDNYIPNIALNFLETELDLKQDLRKGNISDDIYRKELNQLIQNILSTYSDLIEYAFSYLNEQ